MKRIIVSTTIALSLSISLWSLLAGEAVANGGCTNSYVVQYGDTLNKIATRFGVSVYSLAQHNGIYNPDHIVVGWVLCLPDAPFTPTPPPESVVQSSIDLVAEYTFDVDAQSTGADPESAPNRWTLGRDGRTGIRLSYNLPTGDHILTLEDPGVVRATSVSTNSVGNSVAFWLARKKQKSDPLTLVAIDDPGPLLAVQLGFTRPLTAMLTLPTLEQIERARRLGQPLPSSSAPVSALLDTNVLSVNLHLELVGDNQAFIPVTIEAIDYQPTVTDTQRAYELPSFALHQKAGVEHAEYLLLMVLNDDGTIGPPRYGWRARCNKWGGGGWWSRFRRGWFGCGR